MRRARLKLSGVAFRIPIIRVLSPKRITLPPATTRKRHARKRHARRDAENVFFARMRFNPTTAAVSPSGSRTWKRQHSVQAPVPAADKPLAPELLERLRGSRQRPALCVERRLRIARGRCGGGPALPHPQVVERSKYKGSAGSLPLQESHPLTRRISSRACVRDCSKSHLSNSLGCGISSLSVWTVSRP